MIWPAFERQYAAQVRGMARALLARWKAPPAVGVEDVEQEVWMGAWRAWERWTPGKGEMKREAYAICSGRLEAQRWLQVQRNSPRRSTREPGRYPAAESSLGETFYPGSLLEVLGGEHCAIEPGQEVVVGFGQALERALAACRSPAEKRAMKALVSSGFDRDVASKRCVGGPRSVSDAWVSLLKQEVV